MSLSPSLFGNYINLAGKSKGLQGAEFNRVASAIGDGVCKSLLSPGILTGSLTGVAGPGVVSLSGPVLVAAAGLQSDILMGLTAVGMTGTAKASMASAVADGVSNAMLSAAISGMCPMVSTGAGTASFSAYSQPAIHSFLMGSASLYGLKGSEVSRLMDGLSRGIAGHFAKAVKPAIMAVGPPVPPPPTGPIPSTGVCPLNLL
jgi:hypothetical protein